MGETCKIRTGKAKLVTRRINELSNAIWAVSLKEDIVGKIDKVKNAIDELGWIQDEYLEYIDEKDIAAYEKEVQWLWR